MKTTSTIISVCIIAALIFSLNTVNAQCNSPRLQFSSPVLVSGTALSAGSTYKFPGIMPGVDAYIKVISMSGGAYLVAMETIGQGYNDAWQPIIGGPGAPNLNRSAINFEVSFKTTAGANYSFPCLDVSAIDVDGDGGKIGEFVEADGFVNYVMPQSTLLTTSDLGSGRIRFQGPTTNRPSIDTSAMDVRTNLFYNGRDKIEITLGSYVYNTSYNYGSGGPGAASKERLNCVYFSKIVGGFALLPVNFLSFDGAGDVKKVVLNWMTENEINSDHFEVERSFNNNDFKTIGLVTDAITTVQNRKGYKYLDNSSDLKGHTVAYYRLKEVSTDQKVTYSKTIAVKLQTETSVSLVAGPNPFIEKINISFVASVNSIAEVRVSNVAGKVINTKKFTVNKGNNNLQFAGLGNLTPGLYLVQTFVNGVAMDTQKMVKN